MKKQKNNNIKKSQISGLKSTFRNKYLLILVFLISTSLLLLPLIFKVQFEQFKSLGIFGVFLINFISSATILLPAPGFLAVGVGANLYNPILVVAAATLGSTLGEATTFLFGFSSAEIIHIKEHKVLFAFLRFLLTRWGYIIIPIFAFVPNPFFDGLGIVAGLVEYPIKRYLFLTFIGRLARNILIAYIGFKI